MTGHPESFEGNDGLTITFHAEPDSPTPYAARKQRIYAELAELQSQFEQAVPASLPWDFRSKVLEAVEQLPEREEKHWKDAYLEALTQAVEPLEEWQARQGIGTDDRDL